MPEDNENNNQGEGEQGDETLTWEQVVEGLPEAARAVYETHTQGLTSALKSERSQRKDLAGQLREAMGKLETDSKARDALEGVTEQLDQAERRVAFAEEAVGRGVVNPRLAWLAAQEVEAFDRRGNPNWEALKKAFPELFRKAGPPPGNAGSGAGKEAPPAAGMNAFIRRSAGRE